MRDDLRIPDLTFPTVVYGANETPWNLEVLLYRGGGGANSRHVRGLIESGTLGDVQFDRLELVIKLHAEINTSLAAGNSRETAENSIRMIRSLFGFADEMGHALTLNGIAETYCIWADWLHQRTRVRKRASNRGASGKMAPLLTRSAWTYGSLVGTLLDRILERRTSIIELTRLQSTHQRKTAVGVQAEKQNLADTFVFGHMVQDFCDALSLEVLLETPFPIRITLRNGKDIAWRHPPSDASSVEECAIPERYHIANLRIEAELLMFIAQTGMNVTQAMNLELRHFSYVSHLDGYHVKEYKKRSGGTVLFEIFKDYKPHFERYLAWRRRLFEASTWLFPFIGRKGSRQESRFQNGRIRNVCLSLKVPYISPRNLRNTRVNWLLRSSGDPDLTAEMAQHAKETLIGVYERPSFQRSLVESAHLWVKLDPHLNQMPAVAPGGCTGAPSVTVDIPPNAPSPDCVKPSGCLWCENHRDVDSPDHIWALCSFMHLKKIELAKAVIPTSEWKDPPPRLAIDRLQDKLRWYEQSSEPRREWVKEAQTRIAEGEYHPAFAVEISELEGEHERIGA